MFVLSANNNNYLCVNGNQEIRRLGGSILTSIKGFGSLAINEVVPIPSLKTAEFAF